MSFLKYLTDLRTFPKDAVRAWRVGGWAALRDEVRKRTVDWVGGYVRRFVIETDLSRLYEVSAPLEVEIRAFTGPDWQLLGDLARSRLVPQFDEAAAAGRICLVAWKRRQAVGYAWFSPRIESRHEAYDLPIPSDTIYIWQVEVSRNERRQDLAAALLSRGLQLGWERGFHRSWIIVHSDTDLSLQAVVSVGPSRVLGTVGRLKVLSWMRSRYRALSAPVPIEISLSN